MFVSGLLYSTSATGELRGSYISHDRAHTLLPHNRFSQPRHSFSSKMFSNTLRLSGLLALFLSISLLISSTTANPIPDSSAALEPRALGCPSVKVLPNNNQMFYGTLTRPEIATFEGGYYEFVKSYYSSNFTITDTTTNYPTWIQGKKRAVLGTWAKTNQQFAKGLTVNLPKIRDIFDIAVVGNVDSSFGQGAKCRETTIKATFSAKLKKNFS